MIKKSVYFLSLMLMTAACGGGSGDGSGGGTGPSYNSLVESSKTMVERELWTDYTQFDMLPVSGTASFSGTSALYSIDSDSDMPDLMSQASLTANFDQSTIRGDLTNFRDRSNNSIAGSVGIDGEIYRDFEDDAGFVADLNGSLVTNGQANKVSGTADGYFFGDRGHLASAELDLTIGNESYHGVMGADR